MTDLALKRRVEEELELEPSLDTRGVHVAVANGIVSLLGSVTNYAERVAAERVTHTVRTVRAVVNELDVQVPLPQRRSDAELVAAAAQALHWDVTVPRDVVQARVANAWIDLEGTVDRPFQRMAAERAVERLVGIRGITNHIALKPGACREFVEDEVLAVAGHPGVDS